MNNQPNPYNPYGITPTYYQPPNYVTQGQNNAPSASPQRHNSPWLLAFGVIDICMSGLFFIWSIIISFGWSTTITAYVALTCAVFHLVLGALSILGARDGVRYRGFLIATIVMGIVGPCIFVCATMTSDIIEWADIASSCRTCKWFNEICPTLCYFNIKLVFIPVLLYSIFQAIVSAVISSISCCNLCYCCGCCYTGAQVPSQSLLYHGPPPSYVSLAVPHDNPTSSNGVVGSNPPNHK